MKFLKYIGATVLSIAALVLILPYFVSLNSYKAEIIEKVQDISGRALTIQGDLKFRILPRPYLKATQVTLASAPHAQEPTMISIKELDVVLSVLPLFVGKIEVAKVVLDRPHVTLEHLKNGKGNWEIDFKAAPSSLDKVSRAPKPASQDVEKQSPAAPKDPAVLVKVIQLNKASVRYIKGKEVTTVTDLNLSLDLNSFEGPIDFALGFRVFEENVQLTGRLKELGNQIPLEAKLIMGGDKLSVGGIVSLVDKKFTGDLELKGSLKPLKKMMPDLKFPNPLKEKYSLKSTVLATADQFSLEAIEFNLHPLQAYGSLIVDLKKTTGMLKLDLMPGGIHVDVRPDARRPGQFSGTLSLKAKEGAQLLQALDIKTQDLPLLFQKAFAFETHVTYKDQEIVLKKINLDGGEAHIGGELTLQNWNQKARSTFDVRSKDLSAFCKAINFDVPNSFGAFRLKGKASGSLSHLDLDLNVYGARATTHIKGSVQQHGTSIKPDLLIVMQGKNLKSTLAHLGQTGSSKGMGSFKLQTSLMGDIPQHLKCVVQNSFLRVGKERIDLKGALDLVLRGAKPKVHADVVVSSLNLDNLLAAFDDTAPRAGHVRQVARRSTGKKSTPKIRWSHDKIDFGFLRDFDGDIKISIPSLRKGALIFDAIKMDVHVANGILDLTSLTGNLYGGSLLVKARASSQKDQPITLTAHLKEAQLKNIFPKQKEIKILKGRFNLNADLSTSGHSESQYVSNLSGSMNFNGTKGSLSGFNLTRVVRDIKNTRSLGAALGLLNTAFSGGETAFNSLDCVTSIAKGKVRIEKFLLDAVGADMTADGAINLLKYRMDVSAKVTLEGKGLPPFSARLYGPLDNPDHKLKTGKLEQYLLQNVFSGVIDSLKKGNPEDILKGLFDFGTKGTSPEKSAKSPPSSTEKPAKEGDALGKAVGNLLKDLF